MEQARRIFNYRGVVEDELKLFVKSHEKPLLQTEKLLNKTGEHATVVKDRLHPEIVKNAATLTQMQAKILVCTQLCDKILQNDGQNTEKQSAENPEHSFFRDQLEQGVKDINAEYDAEISELKTMYEEMKDALRSTALEEDEGEDDE